jgi:hypothetical protein
MAPECAARSFASGMQMPPDHTVLLSSIDCGIRGLVPLPCLGSPSESLSTTCESAEAVDSSLILDQPAAECEFLSIDDLLEKAFQNVDANIQQWIVEHTLGKSACNMESI